MNPTALPIVYPLAWLSLLLLYVVSCSIGYVVAGKNFNTNSSGYLRGAAYALIGTLCIISLTAALRCKGITFQLPLLVVPVFAWLHGNKSGGKISWHGWKQAVFASQPLSYLLLTLVFLLIGELFMPFSTDWLRLNNIDLGYYAYESRNVFSHGYESALWGKHLIAPPAHQLYHYTDFWLCGLVAAMSHLSHYTVYILVVKVFTSSLLAIGCYALVPLQSVIEKLLATLTALLVGTTLFFISIDGLPWFLQFDFLPSLLNYHGGLFAAMYVGIVLMMLFAKRARSLAYALLAVSGCVHPLLLPVAMGFFGLRLVRDAAVSWKRYKRVLKKLLLFDLLCLGMALLAFAWCSWLSRGAAPALPFNLRHMIVTGTAAFARSLFEIVFIGFFTFAGLIIVARIAWRSNRRWIIDAGILALLAIGIYSLLFDAVQSDMWQIKIIVLAPLLFVMGSLGWLHALRRLSRAARLTVLCVVFGLTLILSDTQPNYFFGHGPVVALGNPFRFDTPRNDTLRLHQRDVNVLHDLLVNRGDGCAVLQPNYFPILLSMPAAIDVTEACALPNAVDRVNLVAADTATVLKRQNVSHFINQQWREFLPNDSSTLRVMVKHFNYQWLYADKRSYYMPDNLRNTFPVKHDFGDVSVYTRE